LAWDAAIDLCETVESVRQGLLVGSAALAQSALAGGFAGCGHNCNASVATSAQRRTARRYVGDISVGLICFVTNAVTAASQTRKNTKREKQDRCSLNRHEIVSPLERGIT
jgi:hypothetical protein